jgi:hypothetical protein
MFAIMSSLLEFFDKNGGFGENENIIIHPQGKTTAMFNF